MRVKKFDVEITSGSVIFCDPDVVGIDQFENAKDAVSIELWEGCGLFSVYTDGVNHYIDVDPRILQAKTKPDLRLIEGKVQIDMAEIGICDLTESRRAMAQEELEDGKAVLVDGLEPGTYQAWFEEKGTSKKLFRGVVGFGPEVRLLLNSDTGNAIHGFETRVAELRKMKGPDRKAEFDAIRAGLLDLHMAGCKDSRLEMLASAVKLDLPRRPRRSRR